MSELLPCPFCTGIASHCMPMLNGHAIKCDDCGNSTAIHATAGIAIMRWNSRKVTPASAQGARMLAALQAAEQYIKRNHRANGGWWNDPAAWKIITETIEPTLKAAQASPVPEGDRCGGGK